MSAHRLNHRYIMDDQIKKIHLSVERSADEEIDYNNTDTDVVVEFSNGDTYVASFFTYGNLRDQVERNRATGANLSGKYFWVESMIFVDDCSPASIYQIVDHLIEEGDFQVAFRKL